MSWKREIIAIMNSSDAVNDVKGTILVVEDEPSLRSLVVMVLQELGYRVFEASSGVVAREIWKEKQGEIDLLFTDLVMPDGISGRELADELRQKKPGLKVIYTSGFSAEFGSKGFVLREGVNFLRKPYVLAQLIEIVRSLLKQP